MHYFTHDQKVCGSCSQWNGQRMFDEGQFVSIFPDATGRCGTGKIMPADAPCSAKQWRPWLGQGENTCMTAMNCWEYQNCGFHAGGENAKLYGVCPAYPDHGRLCFSLAENKCHLVINATPKTQLIPRKKDCLKCNFLHVLENLG